MDDTKVPKAAKSWSGTIRRDFVHIGEKIFLNKIFLNKIN